MPFFAAASDSQPDRLRGYFHETRRPLASLAFVLPLLALYEGGVLLLGEGAWRNGADVWLRHGLNALGLAQYFLLPAVTVGLLLGAQHLSGQPWRFSPTVLYGMTAESILLAGGLLLAAYSQGAILHHWPGDASHWRSAVGDGPGRLVAFAGAGVYEEALFRLALFPLAVAGMRLLQVSRVASLVAAVGITSLAFAAAHHLGPHAEEFVAPVFLFRALAGAFFATVFLTRGFGIAAGAHVAYDLFAGLTSPDQADQTVQLIALVAGQHWR